MTACGEIRLLLGPFDDGELEPHEMEDVAFHVVGCADCKTALEDYRRLGVALRGVVSVPQLEGFAEAVTARLTRSQPPRAWGEAWWNFFGRLAGALEFAGVAAAAAVLTLLIAGPNLRQALTQRLRFVAGAPSSGVTAPLAAAGAPNAVAQANPGPSASTALAAANEPAAGATDVNLTHLADEGQVRAASNMQEIVSELGAGQSPAVAVWNVPRTDTTVVWVPDQP